MGTRIYTNTTAQNAHANLLIADTQMQKSIERLSSGLRINRAADDPAGLVISENLRTQISGITQAIANTTDSINMIKTAEGALTEVHSLLRSMRDLAIHAANTGVNDSTAVQADQAQISSAIESLNRIASQTQFGNVKLLDGSIGTSYSVIDAAHVTGAYGYNSAVSEGLATVTVTTSATLAKIEGDQAYTGGSAENLIAASTVVINGVNVGSFTTDDTIGDVVDAINSKTGQTGVAAYLDAQVDGTLVLTQTNYGSDYTIEYSDTGTIIDAAGALATEVAGVDADGEIAFDGGATLALASGKGLLLESDGGTFKVGTTSQCVEDQDYGGLWISMGSADFQIGANSGQTVTATIDDISANQLGTTAGTTTTDVSNINVTSGDGAADAIKVLDEAIAQISTVRSRLGSTQKNVLETSINTLSVAKQNVAASESAIRDTDMASEVVNFTRNQILVQASIAMISQANSAPQSLLSLLK